MGDGTAGVKPKLLPPDGGWGWCVVIGSSLINLFTRAIEPSFGLLFGDLLRDLGVATTEAAIVVSVLETTVNFSGFFVGPLIRKFSYRKMAIFGAVLSATALIGTSHAKSLTHIILTYSCIGGLGFGFVSAATFVSLNLYFDRRRGQAFGLAMAGTACGFMLMPQLISRLLEAYDFRDTMLILGALSLNALVGASLLQPVRWHMRPAKTVEQRAPLIDNKAVELQEVNIESKREEEKDGVPVKHVNAQNTASFSGLSRQNSCGTNKLHRKPLGGTLTRNTSVTSFAGVGGRRHNKSSSLSAVSVCELMGSNMHIQEFQETDSEDECEHQTSTVTVIEKIALNPNNNTIQEQEESEKKKTKKKGCWSKIAEVMDLDLLLNFRFLNLAFGISVTYVAEMNFKLVIPFFMANLGYSRSETAQMLSLMAIADVVACVVMPPINDRLSFSRKYTLMLGLTLLSTARSVLAEQTTWTSLLTVLIIHGFFRGFALTNFPLVVSDGLPQDKFAAGFGLCRVTKGVFILFLGPFVGWVRDYTQSYSLCLHFQSLLNMCCVTAWMIECVFFPSKKPKQLEPT